MRHRRAPARASTLGRWRYRALCAQASVTEPEPLAPANRGQPALPSTALRVGAGVAQVAAPSSSALVLRLALRLWRRTATATAALPMPACEMATRGICTGGGLGADHREVPSACPSLLSRPWPSVAFLPERRPRPSVPEQVSTMRRTYNFLHGSR